MSRADFNSPSDQVWRVCAYLREETCKRCAPVGEIDGEPVYWGCHLLAQETINVVETGNAWRRRKEKADDQHD